MLLPPGKHSVVLSLAAALAVAFSPLLWSQALVSEVYALLTFFAALVLWLLTRWRAGGSDANLWAVGFSMGLGMGNHLTLALLAPAALVLLWPARDRWLRFRSLLPTATLFLLGLSVYAYLPLAAAHRPPVNWGDPSTLDGFLWVVTGEQYQPFVFDLPSAAIPGRLAEWSSTLGNQFGWWGLALVLAGAVWWWQRERGLVLSALVWLLPLGIYAFFYNTGDAIIYMVPTLLVLGLCWAEGARYLLYMTRRLHPTWQQAALVVLILLPVSSLAIHWQDVDLSEDQTAPRYIQDSLAAIEPGSLVIVRRDRPTFAHWYAVYANGQRADLAVVNGRMLAYIWYRNHVRHLYPDLLLQEPVSDDVTTDDLVRDLVLHNYALRPVYATDPAEEWEQWFDFIPMGDAPTYRVTLGKRWEH
jgi:4-amino-4-deoxy-L-arabinose transferase-like glycosyltransferase